MHVIVASRLILGSARLQRAGDSVPQSRTFLREHGFSIDAPNEKFVSAECLDQHAESVRSPEMAARLPAISSRKLAIP